MNSPWRSGGFEGFHFWPGLLKLSRLRLSGLRCFPSLQLLPELEKAVLRGSASRGRKMQFPAFIVCSWPVFSFHVLLSDIKPEHLWDFVQRDSFKVFYAYRNFSPVGWGTVPWQFLRAGVLAPRVFRTWRDTSDEPERVILWSWGKQPPSNFEIWWFQRKQTSWKTYADALNVDVEDFD